MEYYEAFDMKNVAWGLLNTDEQWQSILDISYNYHNIIFNTTLLAKDISEPLIKYMTDIFLNKNEPKVALLMGHDANLYTVLNAMGFKPYSLKKQHEVTPVGGKIVFQKWSDNKTNDFLKIDYVYQSSEQMRNGMRLSMDNPPIFETLKLKDCKIFTCTD
ncbi:Glucose-1-phosphatase [Operophtera brumata]|uniref:Glucose-1-phosphatase n=1 Tax=Operophtera brumata TaxID=104452 RepID=A0A0L7KQR0_OPEBR|nr:Glucose-1-phosphatase [Operophtera brumata]